MTDDSIPQDAVGRFMEMLIPRAYEGSIAGLAQLLTEGPRGRQPAQRLVTLHHWFGSLSPQDQEQVRAVIREAVDTAIFGVLVILDGASGGWPVVNEVSDFALYLQTYESYDAEAADVSRTRIKLNPMDRSEDLHDRFRSLVQE